MDASQVSGLLTSELRLELPFSEIGKNFIYLFIYLFNVFMTVVIFVCLWEEVSSRSGYYAVYSSLQYI